MSEISQICKCGHIETQHINKDHICFGCFGAIINYVHIAKNPGPRPRMCKGYSRDNLAYLESKYNKQTLDEYKKLETENE